MALLARNMLSLPQKRPALLATLAKQQHQQQQQHQLRSPPPEKSKSPPSPPPKPKPTSPNNVSAGPSPPTCKSTNGQINSVSSALERNTGLLFSGSLYLFATSYLLAPYLGWDLSSTTLVAAVAGLPVAAKLALKFAVAWPFTFHVVNGIRYLVTSGAGTIGSRRQIVGMVWGVVVANVTIKALQDEN
ncbi:hypothetical protein BO71DRAFT_432491 [Aspergillus ellipticus CBS 707.79]|uniref:Cytochrome b560 subunit of succinate dehydrogenase n=1 Tax=Aspergillus ellipticus CBS 707.79 TaxID=1448320 RepID=A0A319D3F0_9EURO|nr:hypothetical protein BO71DRAFT_432491 [Aspergillus ellipticus CBS 707.79]